MRRRTTSYDKSYVGSSGTVLKSDNLRKPAQVTIEVPATLSEAKAILAASLRRAGVSPRRAALMVAEVVGASRAKRVAA